MQKKIVENNLSYMKEPKINRNKSENTTRRVKPTLGKIASCISNQTAFTSADKKAAAIATGKKQTHHDIAEIEDEEDDSREGYTDVGSNPDLMSPRGSNNASAYLESEYINKHRFYIR